MTHNGGLKFRNCFKTGGYTCWKVNNCMISHTASRCVHID